MKIKYVLLVELVAATKEDEALPQNTKLVAATIFFVVPTTGASCVPISGKY